MEHQNQKNYKTDSTMRTLLTPALMFGLFLLLFFYFSPAKNNPLSSLNQSADKFTASYVNDAVVLPINWGDLGRKLIEEGVIDGSRMSATHQARGEFGLTEEKLFYKEGNGQIEMNSQNAGFLLNLFWAFGLSNKNRILEEGPMTDPRYGGPHRFASTAGWSLARGNPMDHYSRHTFVVLNSEQQKLVEEVSKNIFRPCCGNSTHFPDCNHGMAMLGLLELLAANGVSEEEMYKIALKVNSFWFPDTYQTIAKYLANQGREWQKVDPKLILGNSFSSASGYARVLSEMEPVQSGGGGGCSV